MRGKSEYKIRRCYDKALIRSLHEIIFPTDDLYENPKSFDWVLYDKSGKPVGFCILAEWEGGIGYFARAGLLKCAQGKGLHSRLIKVRESFARKQGFTKVVTYTKIYNITSSRNLQKARYEMYLPEYEYADKDCIYWMKILKKRL